MNKTKRHYYSEEEEEFLTNNIKGTRTSKLTEMFNEHFGINLKRSQIRAKVKRMGLKSGVDTTFKKGQKAWNKDKSIDYRSPTQFKKGHTPVNKRPVGSERINVYGYVEVKVKEPNVWDLKHKILYRKHKDEIPEGKVVIFADRDRQNLDLDNLILVDRRELLIMNREGLIYEDQESTKAGANIAKIKSKVSELIKERDNK